MLKEINGLYPEGFVNASETAYEAAKRELKARKGRSWIPCQAFRGL